MSSQALKFVVKSSFWLIAANFVSRLSGLLVLPLLARLLGSANLGLYSLLQNTVQSADVLSRLGADIAMHRNGAQHESMDTKAVGRLFGAGTLLISTTGILIALLLCIAPKVVSQSFLREPKVEPWLVVVALAIGATAVATPSWIYLMALHAFRTHAVRTSVLSILGAGTTLALTYLFGFAGALWSLVAVALLQVILGWSLSLPTLKRKGIQLQLDHFSTECRSILAFGLPFYAGNFLSSFLMLPLLGLASSSSGLEQLGNLRVGQALSQLISFLPTTIAPVIVSSLSANLVSDIDSYHKIKSLHLRSTWVLILFLSTVICLNTDVLVLSLFGANFAQAAFLSKVTVWLAAISNLAEVLNQHIVSSGRTYITAVVRVIGLIVMFCLASATIPSYGVLGLLLAQLATAAFSFIAFFKPALSDLKKIDLTRVFRLLWLSPLAVGVSFLPIFSLSGLTRSIYLPLISSIFIGVIILTLSVLEGFDSRERETLFLYTKRKLRKL